MPSAQGLCSVMLNDSLQHWKATKSSKVNLAPRSRGTYIVPGLQIKLQLLKKSPEDSWNPEIVIIGQHQHYNGKF